MSLFIEIARLGASILLLLAAAHLLGRIFAYLRQPRVIGEIVGGVLLGPTLLGWMSSDATHWLFPRSGPTGICLSIISQIGLVLLMYASGRQFKTFISPDEKKLVGIISLTGTLLPLLAGLGYLYFFDATGWLGTKQNYTAFVLVFATAIAIASIPVISRIMLDLGILETSFARIVVATAVIDDLILYVVLAVALGLVTSTGASAHGLFAWLGVHGSEAVALHVVATVATIVLTLLAGPWIWRVMGRVNFRFVRWDGAAALHIVFLSLVTACCLLLDVNPMFGALAAGIVAGRATQQQSISASRFIKHASMIFFIPLYFGLIGVRLDLVHHLPIVEFLIFLAFACVVKGSSIYAGARLAGESHSAALNLGAALNARGGPGIVLAAVTFEAGIINEDFFATLIMLAIVTSMAAGVWLERVVRRGAPLRGPTLASLSQKATAVETTA